MALLKADQITKVFKAPLETKILDGLSLELHERESIAIMGRSGEGKSTLLHILGTLEPQTSGSLEIVGQKVSLKAAPNIRNRHIGFIFQAFHLLDDATVLQNILLPAFIGGKEIRKGSAAFKRAHMLLERVGLENRQEYQTRLLSGGEKQRVAIARALLNDPEIILADEPSGNLDSSTSEKIHSLLLETTKEFNKGLILVTHNAELASLCNKTLILKQGRLS